MSISLNSQRAKIAINKSLVKEYSGNDNHRVVYLKDGDEFQIQLYNPETKRVKAKIYLNGISMSDELVLRPGERVWLERYFDKPEKFKFLTYEVDSSDETKSAIQENGHIKIEFYPEIETIKLFETVTPSWYSYPNNVCYSSTVDFQPSECLRSDVNCVRGESSISSVKTSLNASKSQIKAQSLTDSIETGRVDRGGYSNQTFNTVDGNFSSWCSHSEDIYILPASRKALTSRDVNKRYCTQCGKKLSPKFKFCPVCGTKVD